MHNQVRKKYRKKTVVPNSDIQTRKERPPSHHHGVFSLATQRGSSCASSDSHHTPRHFDLLRVLCFLPSKFVPFKAVSHSKQFSTAEAVTPSDMLGNVVSSSISVRTAARQTSPSAVNRNPTASRQGERSVATPKQQRPPQQ